MTIQLKLTHVLTSTINVTEGHANLLYNLFLGYKRGTESRETIANNAVCNAFDKLSGDAPHDLVLHTVMGECIAAVACTAVMEQNDPDEAEVRFSRVQFDTTPAPMEPTVPPVVIGDTRK